MIHSGGSDKNCDSNNWKRQTDADSINGDMYDDDDDYGTTVID